MILDEETFVSLGYGSQFNSYLERMRVSNKDKRIESLRPDYELRLARRRARYATDPEFRASRKTLAIKYQLQRYRNDAAYRERIRLKQRERYARKKSQVP